MNRNGKNKEELDDDVKIWSKQLCPVEFTFFKWIIKPCDGNLVFSKDENQEYRITINVNNYLCIEDDIDITVKSNNSRYFLIISCKHAKDDGTCITKSSLQKLYRLPGEYIKDSLIAFIADFNLFVRLRLHNVCHYENITKIINVENDKNIENLIYDVSAETNECPCSEFVKVIPTKTVTGIQNKFENSNINAENCLPYNKNANVDKLSIQKCPSVEINNEHLEEVAVYDNHLEKESSIFEKTQITTTNWPIKNESLNLDNKEEQYTPHLDNKEQQCKLYNKGQQEPLCLDKKRQEILDNNERQQDTLSLDKERQYESLSSNDKKRPQETMSFDKQRQQETLSLDNKELMRQMTGELKPCKKVAGDLLKLMSKFNDAIREDHTKINKPKNLIKSKQSEEHTVTEQSEEVRSVDDKLTSANKVDVKEHTATEQTMIEEVSRRDSVDDKLMYKVSSKPNEFISAKQNSFNDQNSDEKSKSRRVSFITSVSPDVFPFSQTDDDLQIAAGLEQDKSQNHTQGSSTFSHPYEEIEESEIEHRFNDIDFNSALNRGIGDNDVLRITLDVSDFKPEQLKMFIIGNEIHVIVEVYHLNGSNKIFEKTFMLPKNAVFSKSETLFTNEGILQIDVPIKNNTATTISNQDIFTEF